MPTLEATCSLDLGCPVEEFSAFCDQHPERTVVVYANTSAAVKARADWVVTSSCALEIVESLMDNGEKILWAPDQHLGRYIQRETGADMLLWEGACIVHEEFKAEQLQDLKALYPDAAVLVHPESPEAVVALADAVGSTSQLIKAAQTMPNPIFIVATDRGILYKMQQLCPGKSFIEAPTAGQGATCRSCAHCPWMAMNTLERTLDCLRQGSNEIHVDPALIPRAVKPLKRMLDFTQAAASEAGRQRLRMRSATEKARQNAGPFSSLLVPARPGCARALTQQLVDGAFLVEQFAVAGVDARGQLEVAAGAAPGEVQLLQRLIVVADPGEVFGARPGAGR